uniref:NAC domain-containing protein n=1 Tax=Oryza brachyantha TaxID=4533 RepID=J3N8L0_ORYBR
MAGSGVFMTLLNVTTVHLPTGYVFRPSDGELVLHYLYRRAIQVPLLCDFIIDVEILRHNPWDIVRVDEKNGKHFFTRKERKHPGDHRSNRATGNGFWRQRTPYVIIPPSISIAREVVLAFQPLAMQAKGAKSAFSTSWGSHPPIITASCLTLWRRDLMSQLMLRTTSMVMMAMARTNQRIELNWVERWSDGGRYFFTKKETKYPGSQRSNRVAIDGFWRFAGSEKPVYYNPADGGDRMLVGMKRTLTFHYRISRTRWGMTEFRLASSGLLPCPVMKRVIGDGSNPPCNCAEATIVKTNDALSAVLRYALSLAPLVKTSIKPDGSWLICRIYRKRQRAPRVVVPPAIANAGEENVAPPANDNAREAQVHFVDFMRQAPHLDQSSPCSCIMDPALEERSDESAGGSNEKDQEANSAAK